MKYDNTTHITTIEDVKVFFKHLVIERKISFHPDDDFADYVNSKTQGEVFKPTEVKNYNRLMDECFQICEDNRADIYSIGLSIIQMKDRDKFS